MTLTSRRRQAGKGQALVEFALVIPIFILIVVAIFDLGSAVFSYNSVTNAAREGARMAIVNQDIPTIIARAKQQTAIAEISDPSVKVHFYQPKADGTPDTSRVCPGPGETYVPTGCLVVITFESTYTPITPIIGDIIGTVTFQSDTMMAVEYSCPNDSIPNAADCPRN